MNPFRLQVKLFLANPDAADLPAISALFQRWIQTRALEGLLIDVADYSHVFQGPGVVLIGHESEYSVENRDGRLGLLLTRKHQDDIDLPTQLRAALRLLLTAARLLEDEPSFSPRLRFRADEIEIRFPDRLQFPNQPESFDLIRNDLQAIMTGLYASDSVEIEPISADPRYLFTVTARSEAAFSISELFDYIQANAQK